MKATDLSHSPASSAVDIRSTVSSKFETPLRMLLLLGLSGSASAHHMMGGAIPSTASEGFISGLAHPVIGVDHLVFVVALGLLAAWKAKPGIGMPLAFVVATVIGCQLTLSQVDIPLVEIGIAISIVLVGAALLARVQFTSIWYWTAAAAAGVLHGYAYGESIVGAQMVPTTAYMLGFAIVQTLIAFAVMKGARWTLRNSTEQLATRSRVAGVAVSLVGVLTAAQAMIG